MGVLDVILFGVNLLVLVFGFWSYRSSERGAKMWNSFTTWIPMLYGLGVILSVVGWIMAFITTTLSSGAWDGTITDASDRVLAFLIFIMFQLLSCLAVSGLMIMGLGGKSYKPLGYPIEHVALGGFFLCGLISWGIHWSILEVPYEQRVIAAVMWSIYPLMSLGGLDIRYMQESLREQNLNQI